MPQADRLLKIKNRLDAGQLLGKQALLDELEVSFATLKRDMACLRNEWQVPVRFDRERNGWRLDGAAVAAGNYALDLKLREDEIRALLVMQHLLSRLEPGGLLGTQIGPLQRRLARLLDKGLGTPADVARRIRVLALGARRLELPHFQAAAQAVLRRRRLRIVYRARSHGRVEEREVSPQRLVHYRENWHLDAWCHRHEGLRIFSLDAVEHAQVLDSAAVEMHDADLDDQLARGYGIFAGSQVQMARLRFTPERARWVSAERWHPDQRGRFDPQGHWLLDLPFADMRELVMDILRHVPEVEVQWPQELADEVRRRLQEGLQRMQGAG
ncbi:YafY family protein [Pseudorhodoferax sp. Leaf274]|uniref:helix-turn-helix transcriptional regulator n=1 Tax=Pseudorhodoferax sp. Leaf274 TaxID=1736318 RepID=UPI0007038E10|nr:WYL domain-containing protein [Pseudorhodoferax sp. Leaf274]KQP38077.1 DNA-binding protein [Pseudorhodoferax sp. Leaf274]